MKNVKRTVAVAGLAAAAAMGMSLTTAGSASAELVGTACTAYAEKVPTGPGSVAGMAMDPVAVAASNNPMLTTLTKAISGQLNPNVNLVDTLNGGEFTVFAPTDDAFAKIDPATIEKLKTDSALLTSILTYHVVPGQASPMQVVGTHKTVQGADVNVTGMGGGLKVNDASVVCGGVSTANAQVYMIDTVLMPPTN
ncbi:fasciclin domain-containing protein [Mycobacterium sp. ITM-2016-00318]|uniref:fasciclin domain-containing protein n=1 Tax=Mycobacterium sp. ITM-2016-00318 TaxID=2099693 RepID=UPI000CF96485|nr:fasciclin domain-containing protein [Mycobacterium sp. ITM-2016-00318]WNG94793.1 fasciclin domain-containing protein [Mycobacterium sp. ITM-2016-00318]